VGRTARGLMADPVPAAKEPPPAEAPSLGELLELSLTALVNAPGAFERLAARPTPRPGASFALALMWGAAFFGLNLVHVAISSPGRLNGFAPWQLAAAAGAGLGVWTALYLLGSALMFALGRALGPAGAFDRALLVAAVTLAAAPAQALIGWAPAAWPVPVLVAGWIASCGLRSLFKAEAWAARGACAVLAAAALGAQYGAGVLVGRYAAAAAPAALGGPTAAQVEQLQKQMLEAQALVESLPAAGAAPEKSSLDLLRVSEDEEAPAAGPTKLQQLKAMSAKGEAVNAKADALGDSVVGMLDSLEPMLNNPAITQGMSLQQKSDFKELKGLIAELKGDIAGKRQVSAKDQQAQMLKIQSLVLRMMAPGAKP